MDVHPSESGSLESGALRTVSRPRGVALLILGWVAWTLGLVTTMGAFVYIGFIGQNLGWQYFVLFPSMLAGAAVVHYGQQARLTGRRHLTKVARFPPADQLFVLYLRSFRDDVTRAGLERPPLRPEALAPMPHLGALFFSGRSMEEHLIACLRDLGPVIAVGSPSERLPPAGAQRLYLPREGWQQPVRDLLSRARLVVIALDNSPGTLWEFVEATRLVTPERLLLLAPATKTQYEDFRQQATAALRDRAGRIRHKTGENWSPRELPEYRHPIKSSLSSTQAISGLISYSPDWTPTFSPLISHPLYDVLHSTVGRAARPMLDRLLTYEEMLPVERDPRIEKQKQFASTMEGVGRIIFFFGLTLLALCLKDLWEHHFDLTQVRSDWWPKITMSVLAIVYGWGFRRVLRRFRVRRAPLPKAR